MKIAKRTKAEAAMLPFSKISKVIGLGLAACALVSMLGIANPSLAQEHYPAVARISFVSGAVSFSRGDDPDEWDDVIQNVPLTIGDRLYSSADGRVELQLSSGNFVRLAPRSYFSNLNLSDDVKQFYLGEGVASFSIRRLPSDEVIEIDTPNVAVTLEEPGNYRIAVDENGDSRITVRRGRVTVAANGRQITLENSEMRIYGIDSPRYDVVGLPATDAFDRWASERDIRFDRSYSDAYRYASDDIIGVEDLSDSGRWEEIPDYGYAWTPASVAAGWLPFSNGRWLWQDPWGWTWISNERWGWATSHYGRWTQYRSRWYWVPVRPRTRVVYAPACVEFVRVRDYVGWFPLHPRDRYVPWWDRRERERFDRNITYVNRNYVTIVNQNIFVSARPVNREIVRDTVIVRDARAARLTAVGLPIPNRSSIRVFPENGAHHGYKPPVSILNRAAVVRSAPPLQPPTFREKLPAIEKAEGKPVDPSQAAALITRADKPRIERVRIRPAADETRGSTFAARDPSASSGPAPQPITPARGKRLAMREAPAMNPVATEQAVDTASKPEQDRGRERQSQQQDLNRRQQEQQNEQQRKALSQQQLEERQKNEREIERRQAQQRQEERQLERQKQPQVQQPRQELQPRPSREQQRLEELERQTQREEERKAQALQQEQARKAQALQQRQEQERRKPREEQVQERQQEQARKAQALQQQQEEARRAQARQQQVQEQRELQRQRQQQDVEQRQAQRRAQQPVNQERGQQQKQPQSERRPAPQPEKEG